MKFELVERQLRTAFSAWCDGNTHVDVSPPKAGPSAKPFIVSFIGDRWHAGAVLVYAQTAEHAVTRVHTALLECARIQEPYRKAQGQHWHRPGDPRRILDGVASGELRVLVSEHDTDMVLCAGPWASNDGLCY